MPPSENANIRPSFTSEQALAVSRAVGAAIGLARGIGANTEFTLQDVATLRNARLTLAGAMAVAMDEERQAMEPERPPLTVTVDVNHYYKTTLPCSALTGSPQSCTGYVQGIIDAEKIQFFCNSCGRSLFSAVAITEERAIRAS